MSKFHHVKRAVAVGAFLLSASGAVIAPRVAHADPDTKDRSSRELDAPRGGRGYRNFAQRPDSTSSLEQQLDALNLNTSQQVQVQTAFAKERAQMEALQAQMRALQQQTRASVEAALTPEQRQQLGSTRPGSTNERRVGRPDGRFDGENMGRGRRGDDFESRGGGRPERNNFRDERGDGGHMRGNRDMNDGGHDDGRDEERGFRPDGRENGRGRRMLEDGAPEGRGAHGRGRMDGEFRPGGPRGRGGRDDGPRGGGPMGRGPRDDAPRDGAMRGDRRRGGGPAEEGPMDERDR